MDLWRPVGFVIVFNDDFSVVNRLSGGWADGVHSHDQSGRDGVAPAGLWLVRHLWRQVRGPRIRLRAWLELSTVVIMGKSFLAEGGQNPAEAVMAGKPVVFGPHMENFGPLVDLLLHAKGALQVQDLSALKEELKGLLLDTNSRSSLAEAGQKALLRHDGATARTALILLSVQTEERKKCL